jgi:hypothetical protein
VNPKGRSTLKITPREIEVSVGESKSFKGHGGTEPYTFAFAPAGNVSGGVVDRDTGAYTAGSTAGTDTVRVTDAAGDTDDARITVIPPLTIAPASASLVCGGTQSFRADGGTPPYTFDWAPGGDTTGGSIGPGASPGTGAYVAGQAPGTDRVRVSDARGNSADASIDVVDQLQLAADDDAVVAGTATTLTATGGTPPYTYAIPSAGNVSGGSVDPTTGSYTAGTTTGTDTIEVTDDLGRKASAAVEVKPPLQIEVPDDEMHKVQLGSLGEPEWWETWESWGGTPANPSSALEITVATGIEVALRVVGGVPDFSVAAGAPSGGTAGSPASGASSFTYKAGLTVGGDRRATDTLTITDGQSTPNQATVTITVTEKFEDLAALASSGSFKLPFCAYRTWHPFIGFSLHDGIIFPPPPPVPTDALPCIDAGVLHTTGLQSLPSRGHAGKRGPVVAPGGAYFMGRGSDAGFVVLHISIPINNILLPLVILLGESKSLFGSSSVRLPCWSLLGGADECDTVCAIPIPWFPVAGLNLCCSDDLPLPTDVVIAPSTILVGMGFMDLLAGVIDLALEYTLALIMKGCSAGAGQISERAAKQAAKKAAKKAGKEVAEKVAKEAVEKVVKEVGGELVEEGVEKVAKEVAEEVVEEGVEKVAKEVGGELVEEGAEKAVKEGAGELAEEGVEKAAKEESFWKKVGSKVWADADEKKRLAMKSFDAKKLAKKGITPDEAYEKLMSRSGWQKTYDIFKGPVEAIVLEQPLGWALGRLGKIDDAARGLEEFDWDWWEFGEISPVLISPIVQTVVPQPPAGEGWWGD